MPFILLTIVRKCLAACGAFFAKPPGLYLGAALLAAGLLLVSYQAGRNTGKAACETAHMQAAAEAKLRIAHRGAAVAERSTVRTAADAAINEKTRETVRYVKQQAAALPDGAIVCIPSSVADRLRGIE